MHFCAFSLWRWWPIDGNIVTSSYQRGDNHKSTAGCWFWEWVWVILPRLSALPDSTYLLILIIIIFTINRHHKSTSASSSNDPHDECEQYSHGPPRVAWFNQRPHPPPHLHHRLQSSFIDQHQHHHHMIIIMSVSNTPTDCRVAWFNQRAYCSSLSSSSSSPS